MGLLVPAPKDPKDLWSAGPNGDGEFVIGSEFGWVIRVPDEWRVPLAAHLLAGVTGLFSPNAAKALLEIRQRLEKQRGKSAEQYKKDAALLGELQKALECLLYEYLEAQPSTSTRYEYRPEYYDQRRKRLQASPVGYLYRDEVEPPPPAEDQDDTPMPWEEA